MRKGEHPDEQDFGKVGRYEICGQVMSFKWLKYKYSHTQYAETLKMVIATPQGHKYMGTVPPNLQPKVGDVLRFTATVKPNEPGFSYFLRPVKAEIVQMGKESQRLHDQHAAYLDQLEAARQLAPNEPTYAGGVE